MEIWQLNTFRAVAKTLHFTRASEELGLTQSAVSHQIKSLEKEFDVKLFTRNKRKITLTPHGQKVLAHADKMLRQVDQMKREIKENNELLNGDLKVVMATRSMDNPYPMIRQDFRQKYKDIRLSFQTVQHIEDVLAQIRKGEADVGFTVEETAEMFNFDGLTTIPYGLFKMVFVVGKDHSLARKKKISLQDLEDENWILFEKESWFRKLTDKIFDKHDFVPKNIFETNDGAVIRSIVRNGEGIAILPEWGVIDSLKSGKCISIKLENVTADHQANIVVSSTRRSKLVSAFVDYMLKKRIEGINLNIKKTE